MREPASFSRQRGMAVLAVSVIMLFLITMMTFYANKGSVLEQKMSTNQLQYQQAYEAARGGMDYALAWMTDGVNLSTVAWTAAPGTAGAKWIIDTTTYPPYNQKNTSSITAPAMGTYAGAVSVTLWRNSGMPGVVEINSTSTGDATVKLKQTLNVATLLSGAPLTPLVANGCVTLGGSAQAQAAAGVSQTTSATGCSANNMTGSIAGGTAFPNGTAWDYAFGISKTDMLALASNQPGGATGGPIYYYTTPPGGWNTSLGTAASPVVLIFDGACPMINGNTTIYGIVYCTSTGNMNGGGNVTIYGSFITDAPQTINGNITFRPTQAGGNPPFNIPPVVSKVIGAWRDF